MSRGVASRQGDSCAPLTVVGTQAGWRGWRARRAARAVSRRSRRTCRATTAPTPACTAARIWPATTSSSPRYALQADRWRLLPGHINLALGPNMTREFCPPREETNVYTVISNGEQDKDCQVLCRYSTVDTLVERLSCSPSC